MIDEASVEAANRVLELLGRRERVRGRTRKRI